MTPRIREYPSGCEKKKKKLKDEQLIKLFGFIFVIFGEKYH